MSVVIPPSTRSAHPVSAWVQFAIFKANPIGSEGNFALILPNICWLHLFAAAEPFSKLRLNRKRGFTGVADSVIPEDCQDLEIRAIQPYMKELQGQLQGQGVW